MQEKLDTESWTEVVVSAGFVGRRQNMPASQGCRAERAALGEEVGTRRAALSSSERIL